MRQDSDRIVVRGLVASCRVGVEDAERSRRQRIVIDLELSVNVRAAGRSDDLADTVDYAALRRRVLETAEGCEYRLIERVAEVVAAACLEDPRVRAVRVAIEKPGALRRARCAGVIITRGRDPEEGSA